MSTIIETSTIASRRLFKATPSQLFALWTQPQHIAHWWGPHGFTNTIHKMDVRPGGEWRFTMHGPDGIDYENNCLYREIVPAERLVFLHVEPVHTFEVVVAFEQQDNGTLLTFSMCFEDTNEYHRVKSVIEAANEENFNRLESYLSKL